jgi:hypothetical protein
MPVSHMRLWRDSSNDGKQNSTVDRGAMKNSGPTVESGCRSDLGLSGLRFHGNLSFKRGRGEEIWAKEE